MDDIIFCLDISVCVRAIRLLDGDGVCFDECYTS